uniref:Uncharacterized protein n=1 Tax=Pinctada fucata TaxID=50426 RepID=L8B364_PINFU|nr:hypothetical protein [Pinctada fucata]
MKTSILCLFVLLASVSAQFSNYYCSHDNCNGMNCREMGSNYRCTRNYYQRYGPFRNRNCYCRDSAQFSNYYCSHDNCNGMNCREMGSNYRCNEELLSKIRSLP